MKSVIFFIFMSLIFSCSDFEEELNSTLNEFDNIEMRTCFKDAYVDMKNNMSLRVAKYYFIAGYNAKKTGVSYGSLLNSFTWNNYPDVTSMYFLSAGFGCKNEED